MNTYESIFIVRPSLNDEDVGKVVDKIRSVIEKKGGAVLKAENWGKKRLAYEVKKEKKGTYLLFLIKGDGKLVKELERFSLVEDALIRFLIIKANAPTIQPTPSVSPSSPADGRGEGKEEVGDGQLQ